MHKEGAPFRGPRRPTAGCHTRQAAIAGLESTVAIAAIGRVSAEITQHLFQVPRKVIFLPELSRTPTEKVIKDELRRLILDRDEGDRE